MSVTAKSAAGPLAPAVRGTRELGLWMCTALVIGNVIGIGIFVMPASLAPFGLNAITGWLITVVGCTLLAISFAVLARTFPQEDGPYGYTKRALGDATAFIVMWCYWVSACVTNAVFAIGIVGYLTVFVPALGANRWLSSIVALSLLWLFVLINTLGARTAGWVQMLTTGLKLLPLLGVVLLGLWVLVTHPSAYVEHLPPNPPSIAEVSSVSTIALFAMLGIECATIPACRVRDPERTIPRATVIGSVLTALIYVCVSVVPMLLIPQKALAASNAPFADLFGRLLGSHSAELVAVFVIISGLGALNGWTLMLGEVTQSVARHGRLPASLARENSRGAPTRAFAASAAIASAMLLLNCTESIAHVFTFLTILVTAANLPVYFACCIAIIVLRRREGAGPPGRLAMTSAVVAAGAIAYCAWASIGIGAKELLWTFLLGGAGVLIYASLVYSARRTDLRSENC